MSLGSLAEFGTLSRSMICSQVEALKGECSSCVLQQSRSPHILLGSDIPADKAPISAAFHVASHMSLHFGSLRLAAMPPTPGCKHDAPKDDITVCL